MNPIMVSTAEGFIIDYSSLMDTMPEFQDIPISRKMAKKLWQKPLFVTETVKKFLLEQK